MTIPASDLRDTISRLHNYVLQTHWNGQAIAGPDAGVRLSSHLGRFINTNRSLVNTVSYCLRRLLWNRLS